MGLDTSHNCWHGSYGGFAQWRNDIGRIIGWDIKERQSGGEGYVIPEGRVPEQDPLPDEEVTTDGETYTIRWSESYDNSVWLGHWDKDPDDVIDVLMVHSDCEGTIFHRFCAPLADRLTELLPAVGDWDERTQQFIDGLRRADAFGQDVDFH